MERATYFREDSWIITVSLLLTWNTHDKKLCKLRTAKQFYYALKFLFCMDETINKFNLYFLYTNANENYCMLKVLAGFRKRSMIYI